MFLEVPIWGSEFLRDPLRVGDLRDKRLNTLFNQVEGFEPIVEGRYLPAKVVDRNGRRVGFLAHLFERLAQLRERGAADRNLREHGAQGTALVLGRGNQRLQFV